MHLKNYCFGMKLFGLVTIVLFRLRILTNQLHFNKSFAFVGVNAYAFGL